MYIISLKKTIQEEGCLLIVGKLRNPIRHQWPDLVNDPLNLFDLYKNISLCSKSLNAYLCSKIR